ncbi:hypothetical protein FSP39_005827 [Pinctada imbricata]|uniref:Uncharacterized protein n=1 Tax=Pinctada imbricata TaxID=66713 RepID=A0AA88YFM8_PINIB|nr:hypothetical protein FSP39_005827 [Pinctada imbricata]
METLRGGYIILFLAMLFQHTGANCDRSMEGYTNCMSYADDYQWAVCLSDAKIQSLSKSEHYCRDRSTGYCWYPCMLLMTSKETFNVQKACKCDKDSDTLRKSAVDVDCYFPQTDKCDWYGRCTSSTCFTDLATEVSILEDICSTFLRIKHKLSVYGNFFIQGVDMCLKKALHTLVYPGSNIKCNEIKREFYSKLSHCLTISDSALNIQELESSDFVLLYSNLAIISDDDNYHSAISSFKNNLFLIDLSVMRTRVFRVNIAYIQKSRHSVDTAAEELIKYIISKANLNTDLLVWSSKGKIKTHHASAEIIICGKKDCVFDGSNHPHVDIKSKFTSVGKSVTSGGKNEITLSSGHIIEVLSFMLCADNDCTYKFFEGDAVQTENPCSDVKIYTRDTWGARRDKGDNSLTTPVGLFFIHHTAGETCDNDVKCSSVLRNIQQFHQNTKNWDDIGYSFLVAGNGHIYEGRGWNRQGSHTQNYNSRALAMSFLGNFMNDEPSALAQQATHKFLKCAVNKRFLNADYSLYGHRDVKSTDCPGTKLYDLVRKWPNYNSVTGTKSFLYLHC